jgi:hypothetical protein
MLSSLYPPLDGKIPPVHERFDIMKHDGCGFNEIETQARVSPL